MSKPGSAQGTHGPNNTTGVFSYRPSTSHKPGARPAPEQSVSEMRSGEPSRLRTIFANVCKDVFHALITTSTDRLYGRRSPRALAPRSFASPMLPERSGVDRAAIAFGAHANCLQRPHRRCPHFRPHCVGDVRRWGERARGRGPCLSGERVSARKREARRQQTGVGAGEAPSPASR